MPAIKSAAGGGAAPPARSLPGTEGISRPATKEGFRPESRGTSMSEPDTSSIGEDDQVILKRCALARKGGKLDLSRLGLRFVPEGAVDPVLAEYVRVAWLYENQITVIPPGIGLWKVCSQLRLSDNKIRELPPEIGKLKFLGMLHVDNNQLTSLPVELAKCSALNFLDFKSNRVKRIPVQLGLLTKLKDIEYELNPLEFPHKKVQAQGKPAVIKYLKRYTEARSTGHLNLTRAGLSEIPPEIGYVGDKLTSLDVSDILPGEGMTIPFELGSCPNLTKCLFHPQLKLLSPPEGTVKQGIEMMVAYLRRFNEAMQIGTLDLRSMCLDSFPQELSDEKNMQANKVVRFLLDDNVLDILPHQIGILMKLEELSVSKNKLKMLPLVLQKLLNLTFINVSENELLEVQEVLVQIRALQVFNASRNNITKISENLVSMRELRVFDVSNNHILKIPKVMATWSELRELFMQSNEFTEFPSELCNLKQLQVLNIGHNKIRRLPREIGKLCSLEALILSQTLIYELPPEIGRLSLLTLLNCLECERLTTMPYQIADISRFRCPLIFGEPYIKELILDTAFMRSPPPETIVMGVESMFEYLNLMRVSDMSNVFIFSSKGVAEIPSGIFQFSSLKMLSLANNKITDLSAEVSRLTSLEVLNADSNMLNTLPPQISAMESLTLLSLKDNALQTLPLELGMLTRLRTLDLGFPGPDMEMPPKEVSRKGGAAVLDYLRRMVAALHYGRMEAHRLALVQMPNEFQMLSNHIWRLSLSHNRISKLDDVMSLCDKLRVLRLQHNMLIDLPYSMSTLTGLSDLDLEANCFQTCPHVLSSLTALTLLRMGRNELSECPVHVCKLTLLQELFLDHNHMKVLPNRIGLCAKLVTLSISHNELTRIPEGIKNLIALSILNVSNNRLTIVPPEVGLLPALEIGDFDENPIESPPAGVMTQGIFAVTNFLAKIQKMKETGHVDLDSCNLDTIPLDVLSYDAVHTIIMTRNLLKSLPESVGNLRHLTMLDVSFNSISWLPSSLGDCFGLQELYLIKNDLTTLPWQFGNLTNLRILDLDLERITSPPMSVSKRGGKEIQRFFHCLMTANTELIADLETFDLSSIPVEVLQMKSLVELSLSHNKLAALPASIVEFTQLRAIKLDNNPEMRDLPRTMRSMTSLQMFSMSGNELKNMPDEIFRLTNLQSLNFSNNKLEGIGNLLGSLSMLTHLDLSHNSLWAMPWQAVMKLIFLEKLELQSNPLTILPASIADLTNLTHIDVGDTSVKMLPADIVDMIDLTFFNLENVDLQGPSTLTVADGLEAIMVFLGLMRECRTTSTLQLRKYKCEGGRKMGLEPYNLSTALTSLTLVESDLEFVPSAILDLSYLTFLDLSGNKLQHFPDACGKSFQHLETLLIRENKLMALPDGIGGMTSLLELAVPSNALVTLPKTIGKCTNLTSLNLKDNQIGYLPKEVLNCKGIADLQMEFQYLTVLRSLKDNWKAWGDPASDILIQGPKVVNRYYKELTRVAGKTTESNVGVHFGLTNYLDLHNFGLLLLPEAVTQNKSLVHLTALNLSHNHLKTVSDGISNLVNLQHLDLKKNPLKRLPAALGALDDVVLAADLGQINNVPDVFLAEGETGVMSYLRKACIEIQIGLLDLSNLGMRQLPVDLSDLASICLLSLERNKITFLPSCIEVLTNLTKLGLNDNQICCLPRQLGELVLLKSISLQGNRLTIMPTELGRLSNLQELIFDAATMQPMPSELQYLNVEGMIKFLWKIEQARGVRRKLSPMPGLKPGETFSVSLDAQVYKLKIPKGNKGRDKFTCYLPLIPREVRSQMVLAGYEFLKSTAVGNVLDLSDCQLTKWRLVAVKGNTLDDAQDDFYVRGTITAPPPGESEILNGSNGDTFSSANSSSGIDTPRSTSSTHSFVSSVFGSKPKITMREQDTFQVDAEGVLQNMSDMARAEEEAERQNKPMELLKSLIGLKKKEDKPVRDLPILRCETDDLVACWMVDTTMNNSFPMPICCATNITALNLDKNKITSISSSIGTMSHLVTLSARHNKIEAISWRLRYLVHLKEIHLAHNRLTHLPPKIGRCEKLEILDVSRNCLVQLPVSIGRLTVLHTLDISNNPLEYLPHEIGGVDNAEFQDVKGLLSLQKLLASKCDQLRYLPSKLFRLTALEQLELVGAKSLVNPPWEVIDQGFDAVFDFLKRLYDCENSQSFDLSHVGLFWPPLCLAEIDKKLNEKQGDYSGMPELHHLDLSHNGIRELPSYMQVLTNLRSLKLDYNRLQVLPSFFSLLTRLGVLSVNHNSLKGFCGEMNNLLSIRSILANNNKMDHIFDGISRLSTLLELSLNHNDIGLIPDVVMVLSELQFLRLGGNRIRQIPKPITRMLGLEQLILYDNKLVEVPDEMGQMDALRELDVADNRIEMLPLGLGKLTNLTKLEVRRNGCIRPPKGTQEKGPTAVIEYLRRIERCKKHCLLDAENFGLTAFPVDALKLDDMTELNVSNNSITTVPLEILGLTRLLWLCLARNGLTCVPPVLCRISTLQTLDLHGNLLNSVPPMFADMTRLLSLNLSYNKFEIFPPAVEAMTQLHIIDLIGNQLTRLPYFIGRFVHANAILLGDNCLTVLPDSIGALGEVVLSTFNLSRNGLTRVPGAICNVLTLETICLSGNALDELPSQMGRLANLKELWIDNNKIKLLPPTIGGWLKLERLLMHNNQLKMLPKQLPELVMIEVLTLSGNRLTNLPWDLWKLKRLQELWIDCNELERLPEGIETMPSLKSVSCKHNPYFKDEIPRVDRISEMFPDSSGAMRVKEAAEAAAREAERLALTALSTTIVVDYDDPDEQEKSAAQDMQEELELLKKDLAEALENGDYEGADRLQSLIDELAEKLAGGGAGAFGRVPSAAQDSQSLSVQIEVLCCTELVPSSKKTPILSPYVVLEMPKAGDTKFKTKVQKKTNNPSFNETFTFPSVKGRYCELLVSVYEKNFMSSDRHVGQVTVGRADVYGSLSVEESFELTSIGGITSGKVVGTVTLKITVT